MTYQDYKPTVFFIYAPSTIASNSIIDNKSNRDFKTHLLTKDEVISGGESVGVIIQGKRFNTHYIGNYISNEECDDVATVIQVSASSFAAYKYIISHPKSGMLFPEELDTDEVLKYVKPYLKRIIIKKINKIKIDLGVKINKKIR